MDYFDLGTYTRTVTTASAAAQTWFDRGLVWAYGFNHEESVACFERAVAEDPGCAMAWWGIAYSLGPNYNKPWEFYDETDLRTTVARTHEAVQKAASLAGGAASSSRPSSVPSPPGTRAPTRRTPRRARCGTTTSRPR